MQKGRIRPPRRVGIGRPLAAADDLEENWGLIRNALLDIHNQNAGQLSFEQLYRASYKIVLKKRGHELYDRVKAFEEHYFSQRVIPRIWELVTRGLVTVALLNVPGATSNERCAMGEKFLRGVKDSWDGHNLSMNMVADVLMYLDRGYVQDAARPFIYAATIGLFRDNILYAPLPPTIWSESDQRVAALQASITNGTDTDGSQNSSRTGAGAGAGADVSSPPTIFTVFTQVILDHIDMDRNGDVVDRNLLRSCVALLEALYETDAEEEYEKIYLTRFEPAFVRATHAFYHAECGRLLREGDARVWLRQTRRRLWEEQARCGHTVSQESAPKIARVLEQELIAAHLEEFIQMDGSGLKAMVDNDRFDDLSILYELVGHVESKRTVLNEALQSRIIALGLDIEKALRETDNLAPPAAALVAAAMPKDTKAALEDAMAVPEDTKAQTKANVDVEGPTKAASAQLSASTTAAIKWVSDILELKEKFDRMWVECFNRDLAIQTVITSSFTELFRLCKRSAEYVSLFIDDNFKRGLRGKNDAEVDAALEKATIMVQHVTEKDLLERYYQKHLARRLLHNRTENSEAEKLMISRMQAELGKTFTAKFEGMFRDIATSTELTRSYANYVRNDLGSGDGGDNNDGGGEPNRIDLGVFVLTSNFWPPEVMGRAPQIEVRLSDAPAGCVYPPEIQRLQQSFLKFYLRDRTGRVLSWVGSAGSADMKCVFPRIPGMDKGPLSRDRRYEITVPTHGMIVLMLFNELPDDESGLTFEEIQGRTNLATSELMRVLGSLSIPPKCRVLLKKPMTKTIRPSDTFSFNSQFVSKTLKIRVPVINAISKLEGEDERKATQDKNNQTRWHTVDAAVVRIMKQRKELTHTGLITEVITQLASRFRPEVAMVKKRIEDLITREYLERIEDSDPAAYRYMA